jgi:cation-transporting P-type ATPase J
MSAPVLESPAIDVAPRSAPSVRTRAFALPEVRWATIATALFVAGLVVQFAGGPDWAWWSLYLGCYVTGGWEPALAGVQALREKTLDVDLLMIVAAIAAASIGQVLDGALLIVIFATSGALEAFATQRTADSVKGLLDLAPDRANRVDASGNETEVLTEDLQVGDIVLVRPGERVGADGTVIDGSSHVDQASITGEPLPVEKRPGDEVFAGTMNGSGVLRVRTERAASETVVARIVAMVQEASSTKAETQLFIERVEQRYSIGMVAATLLLFLVPLALGAEFQPTLLRAMTFMIVASPCAVVLATMPPLLSAIANSGRHGVLVKSAVVMEQLSMATMVAFDKTGTLTEGAPHVVEIATVTGGALTTEEVLARAAAVEQGSEHPLGRAVVAAAKERSLPVPAATGFESTAGQGVSALVRGELVTVGSAERLLHAIAGDLDPSSVTQIGADVNDLEAQGLTVVLVTVNGAPAGLLAFVDRLRKQAKSTVEAIETVTGNRPVLLTGDNVLAASRIATDVGITTVRAGLLPDEKVSAVHDLQGDGHHVVVVGDGVNDAPALAAAHVGIAMGRAGSDLTLETADAVIVRDELATIPTVVSLSRRTKRLVKANLAIACTFITVLVTWDLFGHLPLPLGVLGHEGSTVIVGLNGLRLLHKSAWERARPQNTPSAA